MSDLNFYHFLPSFTDFSSLSDDRKFRPVPEDWWVIITDIKGSTNAIKAGRYKEVNMVGAACITCVVNVLGSYDFPFVFGGDGATMVLPENEINKVKTELQLLQSLAESSFGLELRVGMVKLKNLYEQGSELLISKYELSSGNYLAQFKGSALTKAEEIIKKNLPGADVFTPLNTTAPNLQGLSCRISPLKTKNGIILSLLIKPQSKNIHESGKTLDEVLKKLHEILDQNFHSAAPVDLERLNWSLVPKTLNAEVKFSGTAFLKKLLEVIVVNMALRFNFNLGEFSPQKYKAELVVNSDFKKFDETLRMVLDCSKEQAGKIKEFLKDLHAKKLVFFGTHEADQSLLTCIVQSASTGKHIHFVDGANGGYALAAVELKKQIASA
jgi:hypothetical protein